MIPGEILDLGILHYLLLAGGALFAGFVDSIAGGGGIITLPLLLSAGIPPHFALGTNKMQASFGSLTASLRYRHSGLVSFRRVKTGILATFIGAAAGTFAVQHINPGFLSTALPVLLLGIFIYMIFSPELGETDTAGRMPILQLFILLGLCIGFYDGFFGPGTGSFWTVALALIGGMNLKRATAATKVMNLTSNIVSLAFFAMAGTILPLLGLVMGGAQLTGAWLGTHLVIRRGTRFIRVFFLIVVAATIINLLIRRFL